MELLHVHLVLNLVTLAKNTSGTVESMLEMISLHEKKKGNKRTIHPSSPSSKCTE